MDWNRYVDESSFAQAFRNQLVTAGFDSGIGMLIDTSRNGLGRHRTARRTRPDDRTSTRTSTAAVTTAASTPATGATSPVPVRERPKASPAAGIERVRLQ
ncbi:hypothetical protein SALBM311S_09611 [Streptomyces alboniger]